MSYETKTRVVYNASCAKLRTEVLAKCPKVVDAVREAAEDDMTLLLALCLVIQAAIAEQEGLGAPERKLCEFDVGKVATTELGWMSTNTAMLRKWSWQ